MVYVSKKLEWHLSVTNLMNNVCWSLSLFLSHKDKLLSSLQDPICTPFSLFFLFLKYPDPKTKSKKKKKSLYLFKNNWLFMMINPNEWSKGSHFIRCYLKPIASMAETLVIEAPWPHHKPAWPNLQGIKSSPTTSGGLLFICFYFRSILFFYVWLKRLYICLVGYGFENLVFFLRIWKMEVLVLGMDFFFFKINLFVGFG